MAETRRTQANDPSGEPLGGDPEAISAPAGNRPATGAREASTVVANPTWQGGQGATDFLGLDPTAPSGDGSASGPTDSWLFEIEQHDNALAANAPTGAPAAHADEPLAEDGLEASEDLEAGELQTASGPRATPRRSATRRLLTAVFCLALIGVPGWYGWQRYGAKITRKIEMAMQPAEPAPAPPPAPKPAAKPKPKPGSETATATATTPPTSTDTTVATVPTVTPSTTDTTPAVATNTNVPEITGGQPTDPSAGSLTGLDPVPPTPTPAPTDTEPMLVRNDDPARAPELPTSGAPGPGGGRHANEKDWAGMWLETSIPTEAIRGPTRLRTLYVGAVRLQLTNGEYIEGTLNAVGESRVWVDVPLGRMSFAAGDIQELKQIVGSQGQPLPMGAQALAGLKRVEVLMPGGSLTGRILNREGANVTFVTEAGMRVSVEALDVRPVSTGGSRLVGPAAGHKP